MISRGDSLKGRAIPIAPLGIFARSRILRSDDGGITEGWRAISLGLVILLIFLLPGCRTLNRERAIAAYNQGNSLREAGRTADSILYYRQALEYEPEMAAAAYNLALVLMVDADSESSNGSTSLPRENVEEAVELLEALLRRDPWNLTVLRALGWVSWKGGKPDTALEYYQAVLNASPADKVALEALCEIYEAMDQPKKALENRKYLVKLVNDSESRIELAKITALLGNKREALKLYVDALFDGENSRALKGASEISEELGLYRKAVGYRIRLLDTGGDSAENWWHIARLRLSKIDDYEKGFEALEQALNEGFSDRELMEELARETPEAVERVIRETVELKFEERGTGTRES